MGRVDTWTETEDRLLAQVVIGYISEGKTQLDAFAEVGEKLRRTTAACGFRWNAEVRHSFKEEIERAKEAGRRVRSERHGRSCYKPKKTEPMVLLSSDVPVWAEVYVKDGSVQVHISDSENSDKSVKVVPGNLIYCNVGGNR